MRNFAHITLACTVSMTFASGCAHQTKSVAPSATPGSYQGYGSESVSPQDLEAFAPPKINPEVKKRVEALLDIRSPGGGIYAPQRNELFFSWNVTGTSQVWKVYGPMGFPKQMTGGENNTLLQDISPDESFLILERDTNGDENYGVYWQSTNGGPLQTVFQQNKVRASYQFTTDDSLWIYFSANTPKPDSLTIFRFNRKTQQTETVFADPGLWAIADHLPDGRLLLQKLMGARESEFYEWSPKTKQLVPLFGQGESEEFEAMYGARPGELVVLTPKFTDFRRLYRWTKSKFQQIPVSAQGDISTLFINQKRKRITYIENHQGYQRIGALDAKTLKPLGLPKFALAEHVTWGTTSADGRRTVVSVEEATKPRVHYVWDWQSQTTEQWTSPSVPEVDTSHYTRASLENFPARDGTPIPMFVWRPKACVKKTCPVLVSFHGGPEGQSIPSFSPTRELFLEKGYVYVEPNVRGSDGYGKKWLQADNGPQRLKVITDIEDCALFIRKNWAYGGETPRLVVMGGSYGGYSAFMAMSRFAGAYDKGIPIVGITDLVTFIRNTAPYRRQLRITEYGDPDKDFAAMKELSPTSHINKIKGPMFIMQGATDPRVPAGESIQIYRQLQARGFKDARLVIFPDEGHGVSKRANRVAMISYILDFL